jgi:hypothetical protein
MKNILKFIYNFFLFFSTIGVLFAQLLNYSYSQQIPILRYLYFIGFPILLIAEFFQKKRLNYFSFFFFSYCVIFISFLVLSLLRLNLENEKYLFYTQILVIQFFYFLLFKNLDYKQNLYFQILAITSSLIFISLYIVSDSKVFFLYLGGNDDSNEYILTYQGIGRIFLVLGGLLWSLKLGNKAYLFYSFLFLIILFINGGRSEFALYFLACMLLLFFKELSISKSIVLFTSVFLLLFIFINTPDLSEHRIFSLFNLKESLDEGGRTGLNEKGYLTSINNPILGDFGNWKTGEMSHNFWSYPADYGLVLFFLVFLFLIYELYKKIKKIVFVNSNQNRISFYIITIWFFGFLSSFWYGNEIFGICSGVLSASKYNFDE